jgi:hypothetical protein
VDISAILLIGLAFIGCSTVPARPKRKVSWPNQLLQPTRACGPRG